MTLHVLPNLISIVRIGLVVPTVALLLNGWYTEALVLFALAGLSDGLDGYLARRFGWTTKLGAVLDPIADKLLQVSTYLALGWIGALPAWLVGAVILRDVIIVVGAVAYRALIGPYIVHPSRISKLNTVLQILLVAAVLISLGAFPLPEMLLETLVILVFATTVISGVAYVWVWGTRAAVQGRKAQG